MGDVRMNEFEEVIEDGSRDPDVDTLIKFLDRLEEAGITDPKLIRLSRHSKRSPDFSSGGMLTDDRLDVKPEKKLTRENAIAWMRAGNNVGCYGTPDTLAFIDIDLEDGKNVIPPEQEKELIKTQNTLTIMTRTGGIHLLYVSDGSKENSHHFYNGEPPHAGEIRRYNHYIVCPGSYIPKGKRFSEKENKGYLDRATGYYTIVNDATLKKLDVSTLPGWMMFEKNKPKLTHTKRSSDFGNPSMSDTDIIEIASNAINGSDFNALFSGDDSGYQSLSEADLALCGMIAFYTKDHSQIDSIFRKSGLYRDKWERDDYRQKTIDTALRGCTGQYHRVESRDQPGKFKYKSVSSIEEIKTDYRPALDMSVLPQDNWIKEFYDYHSTRTLPPYPEYWHAAANSFVDIGTGKKLYMLIEGNQVWSGTWTMILGASTTSHKTMVMDVVSYWSRAMYPDKSLPTEYSAAGLLESLEINPQGYIIMDECARLVNKINNNPEASTLRDFLCKMYDGIEVLKKVLKSKKGDNGETTVKDGYPSLFFGTTPTNLAENSSKLDVTSGWLFRFLYYNPNTPRPPFPFNFGMSRMDSAERILMNKYKTVIDKTKDYKTVKCVLDHEAEMYFQEWHMSRATDMQTKGMEAQTFNRLEMAALKLAIKYTLCDYNTRVDSVSDMIIDENPTAGLLTIPRKYIEVATYHVDTYFLPHANAVIDGVAKYNSESIQTKIVAHLKDNNGIMSERDLYRALGIKKREFEDHFEVLQMCEVAEYVKVDSEPLGGRPSTYIRLVPAKKDTN